jgi:L,D-peptidoglycan transpeptidase YkuD (ErfK/YbiS/YcfS/YnhG family)
MESGKRFPEMTRRGMGQMRPKRPTGNTLASRKRGAGRAIVVRSLSARSTRGLLDLGDGRLLPCALGRSGRQAVKREGDGGTPIGRWTFRYALWRADRLLPPATMLPLRPIRVADGWCDAVGDRNYNRPVRHPYPASAEHLWRDDDLYDIVVVLGANDRPRVQGRGSAIFLHLARPGYRPTAGCVALARSHMLGIMARLSPGRAILVPS